MKKHMSDEKQIERLISEMTIEEKASQLLFNSKAIERLGISSYCWWNEGLHGIAQGKGTVFPQAIGMAAAFDPDLMQRIGDAIALEARARHHSIIKERDSNCYEGLTFWCPNVNIFRDPRWGRGMETYGEDPYLTGELGKAFVSGLQGDDDYFLKVSACAKHFAVHSGPENIRHAFNAEVSEEDLNETYLPAFKKLVDAGVSGIMGAYNRTNGEVCCGSKTLLLDLLREKWRFEGYIVSDCWAITDFHEYHKITKSPEDSVALALKNGCNLNCGVMYQYILQTIEEGLITEADIDESLKYVLRIRFRLGMFEDNYKELYKKYPVSLINSENHRYLAREAARKSIVLLENYQKTLPLDRDHIKSIFVTGPMAASIDSLIGNYFGIADNYVTVLEGIAQSINERVQLSYSPISYPSGNWKSKPKGMLDGSNFADVTIGVFGLDVTLEGEEGEAFESNNGDRLSLCLPDVQIEAIKEIRQRTLEHKRKFVLVITGGSPVILPENIADAVLFAWYPGEMGGKAIAEVLFGEISPSGKLPITFPKSESQLPPFENYSMKGRTYRFMQDEPAYKFGFGLSYTSFEYCGLEYSFNGLFLNASFTIKNTGEYDSDEVCMLFVIAKKDNIIRRQLVWFKRIHLLCGEEKRIKLGKGLEEFKYLFDGSYNLELKFNIQE